MYVKKYLERKRIREYTPSLLKDGKWYRILNGKIITESQFNEKYPKQLFVYPAKVNPNGTVNYLK